MKHGFVRNEKELHKIKDEIINKIAIIHANTELVGHTNIDPRDIIKEGYYGELTDEEINNIIDNIDDYITDEDGRYSDYALNPLVNLAIDLTNTTDSKEIVIIIDKILNIAHQRSDLASMFIEGGRFITR